MSLNPLDSILDSIGPTGSDMELAEAESRERCAQGIKGAMLNFESKRDEAIAEFCAAIGEIS